MKTPPSVYLIWIFHAYIHITAFGKQKYVNKNKGREQKMKKVHAILFIGPYFWSDRLIDDWIWCGLAQIALKVIWVSPHQIQSSIRRSNQKYGPKNLKSLDSYDKNKKYTDYLNIF